MEGTRKHIINPHVKTKVDTIVKKVHPYSHCPNNNNNNKDNGNYKSKSSKEIKFSIKNLSNNIKKSNEMFTTLQAKIEELKEEESDLSDLDGY